MSATATLQPSDSADLLRTSAGWNRYDRRRDARAFDEAKRDVILAMERQPLLVAHADGAPARIAGSQGGLLAAFTDNEAAEAWRQGLHPEAPEYEFAVFPSTRPRSERDGRRLWLEVFTQLEAQAVVVNPAGPLAFVAYEYECRGVRPRLRRRRGATDGEAEAWLDLEARATERDRARERLRFLEAVVTSGEGDYMALRAEPPPINRMGSLAAAAAETILTGRWQLGHGETKEGLQRLLFGAYSWGRYAADPHRSIDALLEAGELLRELVDQGSPDWVTTDLRELANALARMDIGYRHSDTERFRRWGSPAEAGE